MTGAIAGSELWLIHRGAYDDKPQAYSETFGLTGIMTAATVRTNGYGTLAQAGWSPEVVLPTVELDRKSSIAAASDGDTLHLVWAAMGNGGVHYATCSHQASEVLASS